LLRIGKKNVRRKCHIKRLNSRESKLKPEVLPTVF